MKISALQSSAGHYSILELDQITLLAEKLGLDLKIKGGLEQLKLILQTMITQLSPLPSAVLAEPNYSFPLMMTDLEQGLVLRLEKLLPESKLQPPEAVPTLANDWGVTEVANNYAVAKLGLWYHPAEEKALEKKKLVAELSNYCQQLGIDLMLKLQIYHQPDETKEKVVFQEAQLEVVQELRSMAQLLVLQYPGDALACATLTAELDQPWLVYFSSGAKDDYQQLKQALRTALENGAEGFVAGQPFWQEIFSLREEDQSLDLAAIQKFIETHSRDRVLEFVRITNEASQYQA